MDEVIVALLALVWNLVQLAFWVWVIYGFVAGRLVWLSKAEVAARRDSS